MTAGAALAKALTAACAAAAAPVAGSVVPTAKHSAVAATRAGAAAAAATAPASRVTMAQLYPQLGDSSSTSLRVLCGLVQNTPGMEANGAAAHVLLTFTSPKLLAGCRCNATAGGAAERGAIIQTLNGLQQLLQEPKLDAVLSGGVRQQRLAHVRLTLQEVQATATALQPGGSSKEPQDAASGGDGVVLSGDLASSLQRAGALSAGQQGPPVETFLPAPAPQPPAAASLAQLTERSVDSESQLVDECAGTVQCMMMDKVLGSDPQQMPQDLPDPVADHTGGAAAAALASNDESPGDSGTAVPAEVENKTAEVAMHSSELETAACAAAATAGKVTPAGNKVANSGSGGGGGSVPAGVSALSGAALAPPDASPTISAAAPACGHGSPAAAAAGHCMSLVDLLEQLQSPCNIKTSCRRQVEGSAACFDGVSPNGIPASVLLTNYIAELGSRAQQCLSAGAVGQQEDDVGADCLAVMQEVEGLL